MVENNIKIETELFAIADKQKKGGKKDLANSVLSWSTKKLFTQKKPTWKWFLSITMGDVETSVVQ